MYQQQHQQEREQATSGLEVDVMADSQRKTANLFDGQLQQGFYAYMTGDYTLADTYVCTHLIPCTENTTYTFRCINTGGGSKNYGYVFFDSSQNRIGSDYVNVLTEGDVITHTATTPQNTAFLAINIAYGRRQPSVVRPSDITDFMLNTGSTALPYEPYGWLHSLRKLTTATEAVDNPLYSDGTAITSYTIKGNTVQNGTPTSSNPVDVNGVGVRTENLWGGTTETNKYIDGQGNTGTASNGDIFDQKEMTVVSSTNYTFSWSDVVSGSENNKPYIRICFYTSNGGSFISRLLVHPENYPDKYITFTIPINCTYVDIRIDSETSTRGQHFVNLMLNIGSTALPYEPYGIEIPISSAGQTTPVYLGEVETTRKIKKLVLTGEESWNNVSTGDTQFFHITVSNETISNSGVICTHFENADIGQRTTDVGIGFAGTTQLRVRPENTSTATLTTFKQWLASEYAAGTPVTVWYALQTATTGIVNEPLMKIGDYADALSNATAIPTTEGANSITVDTTVQPSEFTATWTGWHDASVKEKSENLWNESYTGITQNTVTYLPLNVGDGDYTLSSTVTTEGQAAVLFLLAGNVSSGASTVNNGVWNGQSRTVTAVDGYVTIGYRKYTEANPENANTMLNTGSTALPYEPYWQ